jgi:hypothetical protein
MDLCGTCSATNHAPPPDDPEVLAKRIAVEQASMRMQLESASGDVNEAIAVVTQVVALIARLASLLARRRGPRHPLAE